MLLFIGRLKGRVKDKQNTNKKRSRKKCKIYGCDNNSRVGGVCSKHGAKKRICKIEGCNNGVIKGGVCVKHGANLKKCSVEGCDSASQVGGVCSKHGAKKRICKIEGCNNNVVKDGVCIQHGAKVKTCSVEGCNHQSKVGGVCIKHGAKVPECSVDGCNNKSKIGGVCIQHGAVTTRCSIEGCNNSAVKGGVCVQHGAVTTRCSIEGCNKQAQLSGLCISHGAQMKRCRVDGCNNYVQKCGVCVKHGADVRKECHSEWCESNAYYKNEEDGNYYCLDCLLSIKPDDPRLKTCVRKEFYVLAELERKLPWLQESSVKVVWDSGIAAATDDLISDENFVLQYKPGACSGKRPDLLCDFGGFILVIEIDENQHLRNCVSSEKQKMNEIWEQLGNKPIAFIRFNPDEYIDDDGVKHASTFKTYRVCNGEKRVRATHTGEFEERMTHFAEVVSHVVENQVQGVQFLYYDSTNTYEADSPDN